SPDQNASLMLAAEPNMATLLEKLLNQAGIPARSAMGLYLEDARRHQSLTQMVEVYDGEEWVLFNPATGQQGGPENLLIWHRDNQSLLEVVGGRISRISFSLIYQPLPALELGRAQSTDSIVSIIRVQRLPIEH